MLLTYCVMLLLVVKLVMTIVHKLCKKRLLLNKCTKKYLELEMAIWTRVAIEFYIPLTVSAFVNTEAGLHLEKIFKYSSYTLSLVVILGLGLLPFGIGYLCIYRQKREKTFVMRVFNTMCEDL